MNPTYLNSPHPREAFAGAYGRDPSRRYTLHLQDETSSVLLGEYETAQDLADHIPSGVFLSLVCGGLSGGISL